MTMESMGVCTHHEKTIVQRIPAGWRELFQLLRHPSEGLARAQVWYDQVFSSQYSSAPLWSNLVKALTAAEPTLTVNGELTFKCRFAVLPIVTQRNFLTLLHQYVDTVPASLMKMFLENISVVDYSDPWLKLLRMSLRKRCMRGQENITFEGDKQDSGQPFRYSFSTEENTDAFRSLCKDIQNTSFSLPWQQNYNFFGSTHVAGDGKINEVVSSPVLITSPTMDTSPDIVEVQDDTVDSTCKQQVPEDRPGIDRSEGSPVKRLKLEAPQHFSGSIHNTSEDLSCSEVSPPLTADQWAAVGRLKAKWQSLTGEITVPEEVRLFLSCIPSQTKEVCDELQLNTLSEVALTISCDHLCSLGEELSIANSVEFIMAAVLPKVKATTVTFSRCLRVVLAKLSLHFPCAVITGVITPCLQEVDAAVCQIQMFCKLTRERFTGVSRHYLLERLVHGSVPVSAGLLSLLQILMDLKVYMNNADIQSTVDMMVALSGRCTDKPEDLKFAKLLLTFVTVYGEQMNMGYVKQLKVASSGNRTFLKTAIVAAVDKLEKKWYR